MLLIALYNWLRYGDRCYGFYYIPHLGESFCRLLMNDRKMADWLFSRSLETYEPEAEADTVPYVGDGMAFKGKRDCILP